MHPTLATLAALILPVQDPAPLSARQAAAVFATARDLAAEDRGRLWGRSLAGPILIVDRVTGLTYASAPDAEGRLTKDDGVYRGRLPESINPANTAVDYAGTRWTMVLWPVPTEPAVRRELLAHELWHRIQSELGFDLHSPTNPHLDSESGRVWLRLEARALAAALGGRGLEREDAVKDALAFRGERTARDPVADSTEAALERNEGLAEYTGYRLSGRLAADQRARAIAALLRMERAATVGRSFAYATGPAYGLLLDDLRPGWRLELKTGASLSSLAARAVGVPRRGADLTAAADRYGGPEVREAEAARDAERVERVRELRQRFRVGAVLTLPLAQPQAGFDPGRVEALDSLGSVYGGLRLTDAWGVLDATSGSGWLASNWRLASVPVESDFDPETPAGPGWRLSLVDGWRVIRDPDRDGWIVAPAP